MNESGQSSQARYVKCLQHALGARLIIAVGVVSARLGFIFFLGTRELVHEKLDGSIKRSPNRASVNGGRLQGSREMPQGTALALRTLVLFKRNAISTAILKSFRLMFLPRNFVASTSMTRVTGESTYILRGG